VGDGNKEDILIQDWNHMLLQKKKKYAFKNTTSYDEADINSHIYDVS
jgi:hypothetical protein